MQITVDLHNGFLLLPAKPCAPFYLIMKKSKRRESRKNVASSFAGAVCASAPKHKHAAFHKKNAGQYLPMEH